MLMTMETFNTKIANKSLWNIRLEATVSLVKFHKKLYANNYVLGKLLLLCSEFTV